MPFCNNFIQIKTSFNYCIETINVLITYEPRLHFSEQYSFKQCHYGLLNFN